jgi:putative hydrolase
MSPPDRPPDDEFAVPGGGEDPFAGWPLIGDLTKLLGSAAISRQAAEQLAAAVASGGETEANIAPADRISFGELAGVAQLAAESATGLPITADRRPIEVSVVNRTAWAHHTLRDWRPLFQQMQEGLTAARDESETSTEGSPEELLQRLMGPVKPLLADMTAGSLTGRLARVALGSYDVPLPRVRSDRLLLVEPNISAFADAWSLPRDDTCLWVCVHSLICNATLGVPHVHQRLTDLLRRFARGFEMRPEAIAESLQEQLGELDPSEATAQMSKLLGNPETLLGATRSDHQDSLADDLAELLSVLTAYVDAATDSACARLLGSHSPVREAFRRRRLSPPGEARQLGRLLGTDIDPQESARGARFVAGVAERAGSEGLGRLWQAAENWPTASEIDAAGLWLARLDLYGSPGGSEPDPGT